MPMHFELVGVKKQKVLSGWAIWGKLSGLDTASAGCTVHKVLGVLWNPQVEKHPLC